MPAVSTQAGGRLAADAECAPWHRRPALLARLVTDLVADELAHLRPGGASLPPRPWPCDLPVDEQGLGMDSLERLSIASALSEALHLHESGLEDLLLARRTVGEWRDLTARGLAVFDARLTFRTSGSSGTAKPCCHALADLQQEVTHLAGLLPGVRRVLTAVPAHHIYGFLFTVLLPIALGCEEVVDIRSQTPQALAGLLQPGDLVVSHPAHWALLSRHAGPLPAGVRGVSSTAPCPDALAQALVDQGLESLLQVYGSSETAGIGTRSAPGEPFDLMPQWSQGAPGTGQLQRVGVDGAARAQAVQDRLAWQGERRFTVCGRLDAAVQVGGTNVHPARVREVLLQHPSVQDAAVRLMSADEGARLKAFIVPAQDAEPAALRTALGRWVDTHLSAPERPKAFSFGSQLPCTVMGKPADWPVQAAHDAAGASTTPA